MNQLFLAFILSCLSGGLNPLDQVEKSKWSYVIMSSEDGDDVKLQRPVYLNIHSGGHYGYSNFEVNKCFGSFELLSRDSIRFSSADCTEACCDTDDERSLMSLLPQMSRYSMSQTHLTFTGEVTYPIIFHNYLEDPDTLLGFTTIEMVRVQD
ncbi:META domain-containing protein [Sanyastnella coralliicola]|uniref:META domain-containing protein n=1 Tax=Sanyastnella coralliicola TaxID=3069118 RepID=UPI0027BAB205|nr:META domain-containing protein [Longitalea sp. SCSIO 12813]